MMCLKFLQWGSAPPAVALAKIFGSFFQTLNRKFFFRFLYLKKPLESKPHRFSPDHFFVRFRMTKKEFFIFLWVVGWHFLQFAEVGPLHSPCFPGILTLFFLIFSHFAVGTWLIFSYFFSFSFFFHLIFSYFVLFCLIFSHWISFWLILSKETKTFSNKMKNLVKGDQNSVLFAKICKNATKCKSSRRKIGLRLTKMNFVCKKSKKMQVKRKKSGLRLTKTAFFLPKNAREKQKQVKVKPVSD